jgi:hypothetical protein
MPLPVSVSVRCANRLEAEDSIRASRPRIRHVLRHLENEDTCNEGEESQRREEWGLKVEHSSVLSLTRSLRTEPRPEFAALFRTKRYFIRPALHRAGSADYRL